MCSPLASFYSSCLDSIVAKSFFMRLVEKFQKRKMKKFSFGELFERRAPSSSRKTRSSEAKVPRRSYNEDLITPEIDDSGDLGAPHPSVFPCTQFLQAAGIYEDFMSMIESVGLQTFMGDTRTQYSRLTKIFVESFKFNCKAYKPTVDFKIYDRACTMELDNFCRIIGIAPSGTTKKIKEQPSELTALYQELCYGDSRSAHRGKIRNVQFPAIRYFLYYLTRSVLPRENTSNISNMHLAFLATALKGDKTYNLGALVARRLATKGPIFGGIIAARVLADFSLEADPTDEILVPEKLDLSAMIAHKFVTSGSTLDNLVYRIVYANEAELEVPLPQPSLFSIYRDPLSYSREELSTQMVVPRYHARFYPDGQPGQPTVPPPAAPDVPYYGGAPCYPDQQGGSSSSTAYDASAWGPWG